MTERNRKIPDWLLEIRASQSDQGPLEEGYVSGVGSEFTPTRTGTAFEIFQIHSEPGVPEKEIVRPSGFDKEKMGGDLFSLVVTTDFYRDEELTVRPISVLVRPNQGKAMFIQVKEGAKVTHQMMVDFDEQVLVSQQEVNAALRKMGFNVAVVEFPFKKKNWRSF